MTRTRAAVVDRIGQPFDIRELDLAEPQAHEVVVRLVATGLCHTDLNVQHGNVPYPFPAVLGHEGAGIVEQIGSGVERVVPGDRVLLSFTSCGRCRQCRSGRPALCAHHLPWNLLGGRRPDGTASLSEDGMVVSSHFFGQSSFSQTAVVAERCIVRLPPETTDDELRRFAPLGCGIQTGAGAILNVLRPLIGEVVVITGAGAVGLSAVMAAALTATTTIVAVDRVPGRLALARELGASDTIDTSEEALDDGLARIGVAADVAVDTTGNIGVIQSLLGALAVGGRCGLIGAPKAGSTASFDVNAFLPGRSIVGITVGASEPETFIPELIALHKSGRFPIERLIRMYPFTDINGAAAAAVSGEAIKPVLVF